MLDVFHIAKPQNCHIQIFYGDSTSAGNSRKSWNKPRGVSHVYIMLIGGGSDGTATASGGSGAVTVWYGAAQNVPDILYVEAVASSNAGAGATTAITYTDFSNPILFANKSIDQNGAAAMTGNFFTASGFFQSTAGQNGVTTGAPTASATTFLSAGGASTGNSPVANYGYETPGVSAGFFMLQPIIVGKGSSATTAAGNTSAAYGCGSGIVGSPKGGPGLALIASW